MWYACYAVSRRWRLLVAWPPLTPHSSDYNIPGLYDALGHDWHHYAYTENFGPVGLFDAIYGTDAKYQQWLKELSRRDADPNWHKKARAELATRVPLEH